MNHPKKSPAFGSALRYMKKNSFFCIIIFFVAFVSCKFCLSLRDQRKYPLFTFEEAKALYGGGAFTGTTDVHGKTTWSSGGAPTKIIDIKGATNGVFRHHSSVGLSDGTFFVRPSGGGDIISWSVPDGFPGQIICDAFENMDGEILIVAREKIPEENN